MIFNSIIYIVFLLLLVIILQKCNNKHRKNVLLIANIIFYSSNSFLGLLILFIITFVSYFGSYYLQKNKNKKLLFILIVILFTPLFLFKYFNMFFQSSLIGNVTIFSIIPVGLSFYTFSSVGYLIDVYKGKINFEKNIINYILFVTFFCYYGGPIERAKNILSQLNNIEIAEKNENNILQGMAMLLRGCYMKVFVAETISLIVTPTYGNIYSASAFQILISTIFFGIQLYSDFYGYSLMAKGSAKILNIEIISNFEQPYLSTSIADFWRRWHISLSSWFKDYVYIPLGGNRKGTLRKNFNKLLTFLLSGVWHGANITFAFWGLLNGFYLIIEDLLGLNKSKKKGLSYILGIIYTYVLINISWIFFKSNNLIDAKYAIVSIFTRLPSELINIITRHASIKTLLSINSSLLFNYVLSIIGIISVIIIDIYQNKKGNIEANISNWSKLYKFLYFIYISFTLMVFGVWTSNGGFIYLNF